MSNGTVFLMYHELEIRGRELCENDPGYVRYAVTEEDFRDQLAIFERHGWSGWNVSESLKPAASGSGEAVCFTFDDGYATDLSVAAPLLREQGFNATFYVTVNHLGRRGCLTKDQLRELSDLGMEIGSHSMTHRHLNDLGVDELRVELVDSKLRLEEITGQPVAHFSCPGGRVNEMVKEVARDAGYESVATSRIGINTGGSDRFALTRVAVKRGMTAARLERLCRGEGLLVSQAQEAVLYAAKRILGNSMYERVRTGVLR